MADEYLIQVKDFTGKKFDVAIRRSPFTIGRDTENDLVLPEPSVSKRHATLRKTAEGLVIVDEQSRNGVYINNEAERITAARLLKPVDTLRICSNRLRIVSPKVEEASQPDPTSTVIYYPSRKNWDTIRSLRMPGGPAGGVEEIPLPGWQEAMSRLLVVRALPEFYEIALGMIERAVAFDRCLVILLERSRATPTRIVASRIHKSLRPHMDVSGSILDRVVRNHEAVLVTADDVGFEPTRSFIQSGALSAICIPLITEGRVNGVIYIDRQTTHADPLSERDIVAVGPLAGLIALKVDNLRLEEEQKVSEAMEQDLELAASIQKSLFPRVMPAIAGYAIEGHSSPCYQVGGDYFELLPLPDGDLLLAIGDVSGKGLSSALYMACIRASLHAHVAAGSSIADLMAKLEKHAEETFRSDHFLTLFLGRLNPESGVLTYCNAGHLPPAILGWDGASTELEATDPALNLVPWSAFSSREARLAPGDVLALYTDGLIEAEDAGGVQFSAERLLECIQAHREKALDEIRAGVFREVDGFIAGKRPGDDRTLLLIRREKAPREAGTRGETEEIFRGELPSLLGEREGMIERILTEAEARGCRPDRFLDRLILDEALTNAILHGNAEDPRKRVRVRVFRDRETWGVEVEDEGEGFDWEEVLGRIEKGVESSGSSGRGLFLIVRSAARVEFLEGGRRIVIVREIPK